MKINYIYIMLDSENKNMKVGISTDPLSRAMSLKNNIDMENSFCVIGKDEIIRNAEKGVHKTFDSHNVQFNKKFNGYTEWFSVDILDEVKDYLSKYFNLFDWSLIQEHGVVKNKEKLFLKVNIIPIKYRISLSIQLKDGYSSHNGKKYYSVRFEGEAEGEDDGKTLEYNIFEWDFYKNIWLWFYTKKSNVYRYDVDDSDGGREYITIRRDEVSNITGFVERLDSINQIGELNQQKKPRARGLFAKYYEEQVKHEKTK